MKSSDLINTVVLCLISGIVCSQSVDIPKKAFEMRMNGNPYGALEILDSALKIYPDSARIWFEKGRCLDWVKTDGCIKFRHVWTKMSPCLKKGRKCLKNACRLDPLQARYHHWLANISEMSVLISFYSPWKWPTIPFKFRSLVIHAEKAVELDPANKDYRFTLVNDARMSRILGGNRKIARAHADTLQKMDPVYGLMAENLLSKDMDQEKVLREYLRLEKDHSGHVKLLQQIALIYSNRDSVYKDSALIYLTKMLDIEPDNTWALNQMAFNTPSSRIDEFLPYIHSYNKATGSGYSYYRYMGYKALAIYSRKSGDISKAEEYMKEAERVYPTKSDSYIHDLEKP